MTEPEHNRGYDAGALAFYVRDLMAAAGYHYDPRRPLHEQVRECDELIRHHRHELNLAIEKTVDQKHDHAAEVQRLTDLTTELRKTLEVRDRDIRDRNARMVELCAERDSARAEITQLHHLIQDRDAQLHEVRTDLQDAEARVANLDRICQQRDHELGLIASAIDHELGPDDAMSLSSRVRALAPRLREGATP